MEPDHLDVEPLSEGPVYNSAAGRRKSVFTEAYDPEEDEDDAKPVRSPPQFVQMGIHLLSTKLHKSMQLSLVCEISFLFCR